VRARFGAILDGATDSRLDAKTAEHLRALLRSDGGWQHVKKNRCRLDSKGGRKKSIRSAGCFACKNAAFTSYRLVSWKAFVPSASGHGPAWLDQVLSMGIRAIGHGARWSLFRALRFVGLGQRGFSDVNALGMGAETMRKLQQCHQVPRRATFRWRPSERGR